MDKRDLRAINARLRRLDERLPALTPAERRVVELVVVGLSNHDIGERLQISPKTVEWNLTKAYRKLGARSRTELAAMVLAPRPSALPTEERI